jgi:hypothetical protein
MVKRFDDATSGDGIPGRFATGKHAFSDGE